MEDYKKQNNLEIENMNLFLRCFSCKTEEELKDILKELKSFRCSIYCNNGKYDFDKIENLSKERLFQALLYFNGFKNNLKEISKILF